MDTCSWNVVLIIISLIEFGLVWLVDMSQCCPMIFLAKFL